MSHTSYIELNQANLNQNVDYIRSHLKPSCRYSAVIKGNAYGHGIEAIVPLLEQSSIDHFSVFSVAEAKRALESSSDASEIMIMGYLDQEDMEWVIKNGISFYVFSFPRLEEAAKVAADIGVKAKIHVELETGMNRTGFREEELDLLINFLKKEVKHFQIEGICTHLAGAESITNYDRIQDQITSYHHFLDRFYQEGFKPKYRHMACSSGVLNYPETQLDLVRVGISNYGYWPSNELRMNRLLKEKDFHDPLEAVLSWKSKIMSLKKVPEGEYVSYGKSYLTNRPSLIASVPVGYGYGFSRDLSNLGRVLIHENRVSVIGVVNMNMMLVDVTDLAEKVKEGDEVVLIGSQGKLEISVSSFSDMSNSLNYELLTRLPSFIPRKVVKHQEAQGLEN